MDTILITGAAGYLAGRLMEDLLQRKMCDRLIGLDVKTIPGTKIDRGRFPRVSKGQRDMVGFRTRVFFRIHGRSILRIESPDSFTLSVSDMTVI